MPDVKAQLKRCPVFGNQKRAIPRRQRSWRRRGRRTARSARQSPEPALPTPTPSLEAPVDADLDTLATALYVRIDDLLKCCPERAPWRPVIGICPQISGDELVTLAVMQALLGFVSEARWLRYARKSLRGLFPYLPGQPGYNKRLRKLPATMGWLIRG